MTKGCWLRVYISWHGPYQKVPITPLVLQVRSDEPCNYPQMALWAICSMVFWWNKNLVKWMYDIKVLAKCHHRLYELVYQVMNHAIIPRWHSEQFAPWLSGEIKTWSCGYITSKCWQNIIDYTSWLPYSMTMFWKRISPTAMAVASFNGKAFTYRCVWLQGNNLVGQGRYAQLPTHLVSQVKCCS